ncbi:PEP-CTERM sorting domain-containing protein [Chamaesiphon sp.]|uniref:PEP-CTERM sorting domain-containing protein n=1 Tax=Chamaesiphon sp. TaxID=2814140 RepID=UPI0035935167
MGNKVSIATTGLVLIATALSTSSANAASLTIPTTTVNGTDVFSGPSFTVTSNFLGTDTISLDVSGTVNLTGAGYITNAAGILTQPTTSFGSRPTGDFVVRSPGINWGALLLGNTTLGFRQLFPATTANGLGSSNPPTNLSLTNVTLDSIFGSGLINGTVLQFRISDSDNFNNSGAFTVSSPINQPTTAVPEPFTIIGTLIGGTAAVRMRKELKSDKA